MESTGIPMIGANIHAFREYTKRSRMALKQNTAKSTARNSEGGTGLGSAALLSGSPTSNHSRVLGGQGQPNHAEVPSAECGPVNVPRYRVPDIKTSDKSEVWSWGAVKRTPSSQNFPERKKLVAKRRKPVKKTTFDGSKGTRKEKT